MFFVDLAAGQRGDGLLDALLADVVRLLRDERLHLAGLELLDLIRARVEPDDLDLAGLAGLAHAGGDALSGEQVRREHALRGRDPSASAAEMICAAVAGWLWEYCALLTSFMPSAAAFLLKPAMRASTLETPGSVEMTRTLPLARRAFASACCGLLAAELVVGRDAGGADRLVRDRGVDEDDLGAGLLDALERRGRSLDVVRRHEQRGGLGGGDGVEERVLERGVELVRTLHLQAVAGLLGGRPVHRTAWRRRTDRPSRRP